VKLLLCVHGFPDELLGGTELAAHGLALELLRRGHEVVVFTGSMVPSKDAEVSLREETREVSGASHALRIVRVSRPDLYFDHWQKSKSARIASSFREVLERERPDLVHVLHWIRLTRDLVLHAAQAGVPSVISLNDSWISCPLVFRVESRESSICEQPLSAMNCLSCAGRVAPRTPWVPMEVGFMELGQRSEDIATELRLARSVIVPSRSFGERQLGLCADAPQVRLDVLPPVAAPVYPAQAAVPEAVEPLILGSWGQLSELKGLDLAFEALASLGPKSGIELILAGEEERPGYFDRLRGAHPGVTVHWAGSFEAATLHEHPVSRVHAMLSASRAPESFGLVLEEARALGLPSILPAAGAFGERAGEDTGSLLYESGSAQALARAMLHLRDEPATLNALRARLAAPITTAEVVEGYQAIYSRAVDEGVPSDVPEPRWFDERMLNFAQAEWDRRASEHSPAELGLASQDHS
jgi:glycosyltransferase involved in cell wall biosynthesis